MTDLFIRRMKDAADRAGTCSGGVLTVSLRRAGRHARREAAAFGAGGAGRRLRPCQPPGGDPVALQFAAAGYHTAVLTYSVGEGAQNYRPLRQLNEALALLRQNAGEWHILPDKIAVCGFSAGGHLAASTAILWTPSCADRPWHPRHRGPPRCRCAGLSGHHGGGIPPRRLHCQPLRRRRDLRATMSLENQVRDGLPPFFVWHTVEDPSVPVQNSLMLAGALTAIRSRWSCIFSPTTATAQVPARGRSTPPTSTTAPGWPSARTGWPKPLIFTCTEDDKA